MISKYLEPHQRFQLIQVNKWFQQITKYNKLNYTVVFLVVLNPLHVKIYYERQKKNLNKFLKRYKALLPWINSNNVELKFLTAGEFLKLCYDHSLNFTINMLILNKSFIDIVDFDQFKVILNSLRLTILSLENHESSILNGILKTCFEPSLIPPGLLETCSGFPSLRYLQADSFEFPSVFNLKETYFKNVIFKHMYFCVGTYVHMPLCLEKFHMDLDLNVCNDQTNIIGLWMNQCEYIEEL
jgi:hypothetical protein